MRSLLCSLLFFYCFGLSSPEAKNVYLLEGGQASFTSDAPLELIKAASDALRGVIDPEQRTFAFNISIRSFQGFNSPLQREHFNENYLESDKYPNATFFGKIIERTDLNVNGNYIIRAKGKLTIHGVERERIIKSNVLVKDGSMKVDAKFSVLLREHDITIPRIVHHKIAEEIEVAIGGDFEIEAP
jgi:hypothetical protein